MTSSRLPGKVLKRAGGKAVLEFLIERLQRVPNIDCVIVATSGDSTDDPIAAYCEQEGVKCHRGPLHHVARRFQQAARLYHLDGFVRACGDSPLLDVDLVTQAVNIFRSGRFDLVTNLHPRTFPPGQSVEVVSAAAFDAAIERMHDAHDVEHVTPPLYRNEMQYRIHNIRCEHRIADERFCVDTADDFHQFSAMVQAMDRPQWEYDFKDILTLRRAVLEHPAAAPLGAR
jgi:spore coat polysaccharide biosynthesis protein SpsF